MSLYNKVSDYINNNDMLKGIRAVAVGLSGGADSVCLLMLLTKYIEENNLPVKLIAVHVHHGIRGDEADTDAKYSEKLAESLGVKFVRFDFDVPALSQKEHMSSEQMGRKLRYEAFSEVLSEYPENETRIAVAHHMNDQAETVLFHLARGSGLSGVGGMKAVNDRIIRPLLDVKREEIESYLNELGVSYQTDSTNLSDEYARNKIRNHIIPYFNENINEKTVENIAGFAEISRQCEEYIKLQIEELLNKYTICKTPDSISLNIDLWNEHSYIVKELLHSVMVSFAGADIFRSHVDYLYELGGKQSGRKIDLPGMLSAVRAHDKITVMSRDNNSEAADCPDGKYTVLPIEEALRKYDFADKKTYNQLYTKFFDYDKIKRNVGMRDGDIKLRHREPDDVITVGHNGESKTLNRYFIDEHVDNAEKDKIWVYAVFNEILWVIGKRTCEGYRIDETTRNVLILQIGEE